MACSIPYCDSALALWFISATIALAVTADDDDDGGGCGTSGVDGNGSDGVSAFHIGIDIDIGIGVIAVDDSTVAFDVVVGGVNASVRVGKSLPLSSASASM
jgi:hypothetical protein